MTPIRSGRGAKEEQVTKWTPGPWRVSINENPLCKSLVAIIEHSPERFLAVFAEGDYAVKPEEYEPTARLISAAPELYEALARIGMLTRDGYCFCDPDTWTNEHPAWCLNARAALAKASPSGSPSEGEGKR